MKGTKTATCSLCGEKLSSDGLLWHRGHTALYHKVVCFNCARKEPGWYRSLLIQESISRLGIDLGYPQPNEVQLQFIRNLNLSQA